MLHSLFEESGSGFADIPSATSSSRLGVTIQVRYRHSTSQSTFPSNLFPIMQFPKPAESRGASQLVGLDNQGATCYLNSLIQAMYMTPELRFGLFSVDPKDLGVQLLEEFLQEKSEAVTLGIIEPDDTLRDQLKMFGVEESISRKALIAVKNSGVMEAMDYIDQHEKELKKQIDAEKASLEDMKKKKKKPRLIPLELQRLFTQMQQLNKRSLSTQGSQHQLYTVD